jgi:hypothetical protein
MHRVRLMPSDSRFRTNHNGVLFQSSAQHTKSISPTAAPFVETKSAELATVAVSDMPPETQLIPLHVYQTWHSLTLTPSMQRHRNHLMQTNPEFQFHLFDDTMCDKFIAEHFDSDVVFAFRHLKPGAYKADLWRYCVLWVHGGIYLDIKFSTVAPFKLSDLTTQEHFVRDRTLFNVDCGIYNGCMVTFPQNPSLWACIRQIVDHVKHGAYFIYSHHAIDALSITGPILLGRMLHYPMAYVSQFTFDGKRVLRNNKPILQPYSDYEKDRFSGPALYYTVLYRNANIYDFTQLIALETKSFTREITKPVLGKPAFKLYSSNCCIIAHPSCSGQYVLCQRWVSYKMDNTGLSQQANPNFPSNVSLTSVLTLDAKLQPMSELTFIGNTFAQDRVHPLLKNYGIEDVRIFKHEADLHYVGSTWLPEQQTVGITSNKMSTATTIDLVPNVIKAGFYQKPRHEKNWVFFSTGPDLFVVYQWFPLMVCKINYQTRELTRKQIHYSHACFDGAKGSTCGVLYNNELWFVLHKTLKNNYVHFFAVFDQDMHLLRYSELFKFQQARVEYCMGLIIEQDRILISYSVLDNASFVGVYSHAQVNKQLQWFV